MSITVYPRNQQEKLELLKYLNSRNFSFTIAENLDEQTSEQKIEIIARDQAFENGTAKSYSLEELIAHFNL